MLPNLTRSDVCNVYTAFEFLYMQNGSSEAIYSTPVMEAYQKHQLSDYHTGLFLVNICLAVALKAIIDAFRTDDGEWIIFIIIAAIFIGLAAMLHNEMDNRVDLTLFASSCGHVTFKQVAKHFKCTEVVKMMDFKDF